ncbi:chitinase [Arthrobacter sp. 35W]|uniref:chitinase n=1 Tax=Arthrobacter sp. 35W TaxID=1132441 RepID=UPI000426D264|nr:chitinase [Arthrobacter sp. 35W]
MSKRFPGRKLSWIRLTVLLVGVALLATAGVAGWRTYQDVQAAAASPSSFAGYVDVTATPRYAFEQPASDDNKSVVLSFIVADAKDSCQPSWGAAYSLDAAASDLDLDRRIARLRQVGGNIAVSFGGLINHELASVCTDDRRLQKAYATVVERYDLAMIDLDVEGTALADKTAVARQAKAIAALQQDRHAKGKDLAVWLTLPVAPHGLTADGTAAVGQMLAAGVDLAGVNIMTMDYGASRVGGQSMLQASIAAAESTHAQLATVYAAAHQDLGAQTLWRKVGLTPMIGQNDVVADVFTVADAHGLSSFAQEKGIGRMSMWSLNRDAECSPNYPNLTVVSDACSGVAQGEASFAQVLGGGMQFIAAAPPSSAVSSNTATATAVVDDPATSPYPVWSDLATYVQSDRIVWQGNVYEAKWWTKGDVPNDPLHEGAQTPWKLIGPVLPGDKPRPDVVVPAGTYPEWSPTTVYLKGDRAMLEGHVFEAKWWVQAQSPEAALQGATDSAWLKLSNDEMSKILADKAAK